MIFFEIKKHILIMSRSKTCILDDGFQLRDGFKQSKWKFKMAFAMKGGGVSRGSRLPLSYFEK